MSDAAALMDRMYRRQRHIYDLSRKFYLLGRDEAILRLGAAPGASVLEIGCGTGRNLVKVARAYPESRLYGLDLSREMLATAAAALARAGLSTRIALARADATAFDPAALFGRAQFDRVLISYALSMIPPWRDTLARALDVLSPGGSLHVVDFGDRRRVAGPVQDWIARLARRLRRDPARRSRRRARGARGRARPGLRDREPLPRLRGLGRCAAERLNHVPLLRAAGKVARRAGWGAENWAGSMEVRRGVRAVRSASRQRATPHPTPIARPEGRASFRTPYGATFPSKAGEGKHAVTRQTPARG